MLSGMLLPSALHAISMVKKRSLDEGYDEKEKTFLLL
jgi:hypothetical protein